MKIDVFILFLYLLMKNRISDLKCMFWGGLVNKMKFWRKAQHAVLIFSTSGIGLLYKTPFCGSPYLLSVETASYKVLGMTYHIT